MEFILWGFLHAGKSVGEVSSGSDDPVSGCDVGDGHGMMLVTERVGEKFGPSVRHDEADAAIMFEGWPNVPTIGGVETPGRSTGGLQMSKDFRAWWCHGSCVERE